MKLFIKIAAGLLLLFFGLQAFKWTSPNLMIEGYDGLLLQMIFSEPDTKYSQHYSDKNFLRIKEGMTEKEVLQLLGEPLERWTQKEGFVCFQYSISPSSTHYHLRQLNLRRGRVAEVTGYYYVD